MSNGTNIDVAWVQAQFAELSNIALLGGGGQKLVFAATHSTDGDVVLKLIHPSQSHETVEREILAVQVIRSSRVPRILGQGRIALPFGELVWLREQRIFGRTVREVLRGPLQSVGCYALACMSLRPWPKLKDPDCAWDVKPDNVMLATGDDFWLLDFGCIRHLALQSLTGTGQLWGNFTLGYAPPEQCRNIKPHIDSRSDLFALGVTLRECATALPPLSVSACDRT